MLREPTIAALFLLVVSGCTHDEGRMAAPQNSQPQRVLLAVPRGYKIANETEAQLVLRDGPVRISVFRINAQEFEIMKANRTQMASSVRQTQFGDPMIAARFTGGESVGWKFAILEKNTRKSKTVEYLLTVKGGHVRVDIDRDDFEPFDEVKIESVLATISIGPGEPLGGVYHEMYGRKPEYDLTKGPARLRVFADNYQFLVYDFESEPFEPFPIMDEQTSRQGWTRNPHSLWILTRAHANVHRIDVRLSTRYDPDPAASRQTVHNLPLPTGTLALFEHPNHVRFRVAPGDYMIYCRAYNLGKEGNAMVDLPDDEFFKHDEWERYELILVPGVAKSEGSL